MSCLTLLSFFVALFCLVARAQNEDQPMENALLVFHKLPTQQTFSKRGEISFFDAGTVGRYASAQALTEKERKLLDIADGIYQVQVEDQRSGRKVTSFVKSCLLKASDLKDEIIVHLDADNNFFHFDYYTETNTCLGSTKSQDKKPRKNIVSHVQITRPSEGVKVTLSKVTATKKGAVSANAPQKPGGKSDEPQPEPDVEEKEQTFFQKYWYVFAAITVLAFISGSGGDAPATAPAGVGAR